MPCNGYHTQIQFGCCKAQMGRERVVELVMIIISAGTKNTVMQVRCVPIMSNLVCRKTAAVNSTITKSRWMLTAIMSSAASCSNCKPRTDNAEATSNLTEPACAAGCHALHMICPAISRKMTTGSVIWWTTMEMRCSLSDVSGPKNLCTWCSGSGLCGPMGWISPGSTMEVGLASVTPPLGPPPAGPWRLGRWNQSATCAQSRFPCSRLKERVANRDTSPSSTSMLSIRYGTKSSSI
mmetsp:Transcript_65735/g.116973  ORF Transcript_65735/g.116973 Transcript_65735/m.116973 type:complete len:237 (-) Transcript_65735:130-840(-)